MDVALGGSQATQEPVRIAIYRGSDPVKLAERFLKQQRLAAETYLEELVFMLTDAKEKAQTE